MLKLVDFCYQLDKEAPDHFEFLKETGKLSGDLNKLSDMNESQSNIYYNYIN